ncbi:MAG: hypothetical protein KC643_28995, partial [Nitrospira sp.]|nr:hypothetical protein [Nitrospira sp.]
CFLQNRHNPRSPYFDKYLPRAIFKKNGATIIFGKSMVAPTTYWAFSHPVRLEQYPCAFRSVYSES